jgi:hypothetical protein
MNLADRPVVDGSGVRGEVWNLLALCRRVSRTLHDLRHALDVSGPPLGQDLVDAMISLEIRYRAATNTPSTMPQCRAGPRWRKVISWGTRKASGGRTTERRFR